MKILRTTLKIALILAAFCLCAYLGYQLGVAAAPPMPDCVMTKYGSFCIK